MLKEPPKNSREKTKNLLLTLQDKICSGLENVDGKGKFTEESWLRDEGGGGRSRVLKNGSIFEQAGVNFSEVQGKELPQSIISQRPEAKGHEWFATGTSMVLHPKNPYIPTVHLNYRYFEAGPVWWFGGGADLTPFYPYLSDVRNFHNEHKKACEKVDQDLHKVFKPWCDEYFFLKHRNESRGIGGIFYDYQDGSGNIYRGNNQNGEASKASQSINQSWGFVKIDVRNSSREPFLALYPYSHLAKGGKDINIDSVLPFVCSPKIVPLSQTKLNSTYLPLRYSWNSLSFDEYV